MSSAQSPGFSLNGKSKPQPTTSSDPRKAKLAQEHDQRYKELNKLWEDAEKALSEIPHPNDVYVCYGKRTPDEFEHPDYEEYSFLGFVKVEGGWRICYGWGDNHPDPRYDQVAGWRPITECSQDIRIEAIPHIGKLRDKMLKEAEENLPKLDQAIADFRKVLADW